MILNTQVDEAIDALTRLRDGLGTVYSLERRLRSAERPDGYRTSVRPMEGSRPATDKDGNALPPHSDPTGTLAAVLADDGAPTTDAVRQEIKTMTDAFRTILSEARRADGALARALEPDKRVHTAPDGCRVHGAHELGWEPVHASGRCRWCWDFWRAEGVDPPKALLVKRSHMRRISEADVTLALAAVNPHSARGRRRARKAS